MARLSRALVSSEDVFHLTPTSSSTSPTLMLVAWSEDSTETAPRFHIGSHFDIKLPDGASLRGRSACHA